MAHEFEGRGWQFPIRLDNDGAIAEAREEDKVRQSIEIILRTAPGERVMRPDFGCGIHDLVFDTVSGAMVGRVASVVAGALATWEPRIDVLSVNPQQDTDDPTRLLIEINYRIRSSNSRFNLVFPFYVQ
jgi:phage baseplate assembly protein W